LELLPPAQANVIAAQEQDLAAISDICSTEIKVAGQQGLHKGPDSGLDDLSIIA
jgi:hypothetical protein